jgi:N-acetylglutamate synthase-like GNAT family acetyltransferase
LLVRIRAVTTIRAAAAEDLADIQALLVSARLPTAGLETVVGSAVVAREEGRLVGCAAVEPYGTFGLLRSVCVEPGHRSAGLGRQLVAEAERMARQSGVKELFLLTQTASDWFPRLGYRPDARQAAPDAIRASAEFRGACPESARLFRKSLATS